MRILLAVKWVDKVLEAVRVGNRLLKLRLILLGCVVTVISAYAPHAGLTQEPKDRFYHMLLQSTVKIDANDIIVAGDFNGHVGRQPGIFSGVHDGHGIGKSNEEGIRLLEFCDATNLVICNTDFKKPDSHLITYQSGDHASQIDYILSRQRDTRLLLNTKTFSGEECTPQHRLVVSDFILQARRTPRCNPIWRRRAWKLTDLAVGKRFRDILDEKFDEERRATGMQYRADLGFPTGQLAQCYRPGVWLGQSPIPSQGNMVVK